MKKNKTDRIDHDHDHDHDGSDPHTSSRRGPSALLLLAGLAAMIVSIAAMIGQEAITALGDVQFRWLFVIAAVVVGFALLLGPSRKS